MTALDLTRIKELAQAAKTAAPGEWMSTGVVIASPTDGGMEYLLETCVGEDHPVLGFVAAAQPAAVLALVERLELVETRLKAIEAGGAELQRYDISVFYDSTDTRKDDTGEWVKFDDVEAVLAPMPNDALDDVLPLAGEGHRFTVTGTSPVPDEVALAEMVRLGQQRGYGTEWAKRTQAQRDARNADLADTEGGHHD